MLISLHMPNLVKFYQEFVLKILSENEKVKSIKRHNSVTNLRKITNNNPNLHLVNINSHTKFGKILSLSSYNIERKQTSDIN